MVHPVQDFYIRQLSSRTLKEQFIKPHNEAKDSLWILAFVDGEYEGNCSYESRSGSRRIS